MDVGANLRRARMRKRLTLEQLARATKISVPALDALENNDFDRLPATIYTRGFLRVYAREVGLDPEETVDDYLEQFEAPRFAADEPGRALAQGAAHPPSPTDTSHATGRSAFAKRPMFVLAAAIIVVALGSYLILSRDDRDASVAETTSEATPDVAAVPSVPGPDAAHAANVVEEALRVELKATGPSWISATADRKAPMSALLQAGDSRVVEAKDELVLRVGDPATLSMVINGRPARSLGRAAQPVTVLINKDNFGEFLKQ
jgi:cytoskeleton protein RodZ